MIYFLLSDFKESIEKYTGENNQHTDVKQGTQKFSILKDKQREKNTIDGFQIYGHHDGIWTQAFHDMDGCNKSVGRTDTGQNQ